MDKSFVTSRQRVLDSIGHQEPDKVPLDIGGTDCSGIAKKCYEGLRDVMGLPPVDAPFHSIILQTAAVDDAFIEKAQVDVRVLTAGPMQGKYNSEPMKIEGGSEQYTDVYGIKWIKSLVGGLYFDMAKNPMIDFHEVSEIDNYIWPDMSEPSIYADMRLQADKFTYEQQIAYCLERPFGGIWETATWMCGYEETFRKMMLEKEFMHRLMEISTELRMEYWKNAIEKAEDTVIIVDEADDLAAQNTLLISKNLYMEMVYPYHKKLFSHIKSLTDKPIKINYHTCGAVKEMIPVLIEAGVDILNPVQISAKGMDLKELKREFGRDITFWGASVDSQNTLQNGSKQEIFDEVKNHINILAPGGGYVFAPIHNIQANVPPRNVCYMLEAFYQYR